MEKQQEEKKSKQEIIRDDICKEDTATRSSIKIVTWYWIEGHSST